MTEVFDPYHKWLGIRPEEQPPNHYRLLGIALFEEDPDVITNAADQRMAHVRTFQLGHHQEASQRLLNEIAAAKTCLLQPDKKREYDAHLRQPLTTPASPGLSAPPLLARPPIVADPTPPRHGPGGRRYGWWLPLTVSGLIGIGIALVVLTREEERPETDRVTTTGVTVPEPVVSAPATTKSKEEVSVEAPPPPPPASPPAKVEEKQTEPPKPEKPVPAVSEPPPPVAPPTPPVVAPSPPAEELPERKASQLQRRFDEATTAAQFKAVAEEAVVLVEEAIAQGRNGIAKSAAVLAIKASRKADDTELMKKATIGYVRVERLEDSESKPK